LAFDLGVPGVAVDAVDVAEETDLRKTLLLFPVIVIVIPPRASPLVCCFHPVKTSTNSLPLKILTFSPGGNTPLLLAAWDAWTLNAEAKFNAKSVVKLRA